MSRMDSRFRGNDGLREGLHCGCVAPLWSPRRAGGGRNMLRPYGLTCTYPSQALRGDGRDVLRSYGLARTSPLCSQSVKRKP